jgi:hypothetical protein
MILERDFSENLTLVANNEKDLLDYLHKEHDFHYAAVLSPSTLKIVEREGYAPLYATLTWIKHV